ncbi:nicotinate-nucleotide--dimethylbenzimidazole phosphoribosyltransferase [bacterium]|nr:nicotinate-nucleotide--dimethylbenzimidazole phosphoribosyltransferase [bacterium]
MQTESDRQFGTYITRLIQKENLSREESRTAFDTILKNETTEMQQGAFLAALTSKGETEDEVGGSWKAIYELDTVKANLDDSQLIVDNSGTGMDTFKTFNISTAASLIAASKGIAVVLDGVISTAAGLIAYVINPDIPGYLISGHKSVEAAQKAALSYHGSRSCC